MLDVPVVVRDDRIVEPPDPRYPLFLPGTEQPCLELGEELLATVPNCAVALDARSGDHARWSFVWRAPTAATACFTDRRLVVGCRPYLRAASGGARLLHPHAAKCLGLHLRYETITHVSVQLAVEHGASAVSLVSRAAERRWRLTVASTDLTGEGSALAESVTSAAALRQLTDPTLPAEVAAELRAQAAGVRLRPRPGATATAWLRGARTLATPSGPADAP